MITNHFIALRITAFAVPPAIYILEMEGIWLEIPVGFVNRYDCGVVPANSNPPVSGLSRLSRTC